MLVLIFKLLRQKFAWKVRCDKQTQKIECILKEKYFTCKKYKAEQTPDKCTGVLQGSSGVLQGSGALFGFILILTLQITRSR